MVSDDKYNLYSLSRRQLTPLSQGQHEAFNEGDDNAPSDLNSEPVSPSKTAVAADASKPWMLTRLVRALAGRPNQQIAEELQELPTLGDGGEVERDQTITGSPSHTTSTPELSTLRAESATAKPITLKSPSQASGFRANIGKRKLEPRPDLYEVETSPHKSDQEEDPTNRPAKRPRRTTRAKPPITIPRTSKGYTTSRQTHQTRGYDVPEAEGVEIVVSVPASSPANGDKTTKSIDAEQPKPKKRGRPRINKNPLSEAVHDGAIATPEKTAPANQVVSENIATSSRSNIVSQASGDVEGISEILVGPSPIKAVQPKKQSAAATSKQPKFAEPNDGNRNIENGIRVVSDKDEDEDEDEDEAKSDENEIEGEQEDQDHRENQEQASDELDKPLIELDILKKLLKGVKHVGHKPRGVTLPWPLQKAEKISTLPGQKMDRRLKELISAYEAVQRAESVRDRDMAQEAEQKIELCIKKLKVETDRILQSRLGDPRQGTQFFDAKITKPILSDLYSNTFPKLVLAIHKGIEIRDIKRSTETPILQEIADLFDLLHALSSAAVVQPSQSQPGSKELEVAGYRVQKPTKSVLSDIKSLRRRLSMELKPRLQAAKIVEKMRLRPEEERQRRAKEEVEEAESRRKREEHHRMQGQSWRSIQKNYVSPLWNRMLQDEIARLEARSSSQRQESAARKGKGRQVSVELGNARVNSGESRHRDDQDVERVSVFPPNNINYQSGLKSLSEEDTLIFIDCMRYEKGKTNPTF